MLSHNSDILAMTESWLSPCTDVLVLYKLLPPGYDILQVRRPDKRGSSMAVLFKDGLGMKPYKGHSIIRPC